MSAKSKITKIFVVFPYYPLPKDNGGSTRMWAMTEYLVKYGYKVFLISPSPKQSYPIPSFPQGSFTYICTDDFSENSVLSLKEKLVITTKKVLPDFIRRSIRRGSSKVKHPRDPIARRRNRHIEKVTQRLAFEQNPDVILAHFIWGAGVFDNLKNQTLKIIDTHDIQHTRAELARKAGGDLENRHIPMDIELRELKKADLLLAIKKEDALKLRKLLPKHDIITVGHSHCTSSSNPTFETYLSEKKQLLFLGNKYDPNIKGLEKFLKEVWPLILEKIPEASLVVAGKACEAFADKEFPNVYFIGFVNDLDETYKEASIVINPTYFGSGLKIKNIEALAYGKCLVAAKHSMIGIEKSNLAYLSLNFDQMAEAIVRLLNNTKLRTRMQKSALNFYRRHLDEAVVFKDLVEKVDSC